MIEQVGYTNGIENYSRYFDGRAPGEAPFTLLDYFPDDWLMFIDESHQSIPQVGAMLGGDRSRKSMLIEHGFRLQSAFDNRPLSFSEFESRLKQVIYVSATPGPYERGRTDRIAEQLIRPTGIVEPIISIRPVQNQVPDLLVEAQARIDAGQRVLVTTLTKRMAEELADFFNEKGLKVQYLHSDVDTLERLEILRDLRLGVYDVLIGINLLREGLDLPEVSLVAILDADKEGFLRSETALVQTMGRAARHIDGTVIMYADRITNSMQRAMDEVNRRRTIQEQYNKDHNITPQSTTRGLRDDRIGGGKKADTDVDQLPAANVISELADTDFHHLVRDLEVRMQLASENLEFEKAATLRDQLEELKKMRGN
jgi:excinuclease ABC subunit B